MLARTIALLAAATIGGAAHAQQAGWSIESLNNTIEQTNFVVDGHCSGTLISLKDKLVLTNYHCIDNRIEIVEDEVTTPDGAQRKIKRKRYHEVPIAQDGYDGYSRVRTTSHVTRIVAEAKKLDLALLQIQGNIQQVYASPMLPDSVTVVRGQRIYTVGNPAMLESSVFEGIVSNVNRTFEFPWTGGEKTPMIQFSGGIVGGNSGGALYDDKGRLVGVPSAVRATSVLGLAIPITTVKSFLRDNCVASVFDPAADDAVCRAAKTKKSKTEIDIPTAR